MKTCPVCNAKYKGQIRCHRCKTDLSLLKAVEARALDCLAQARKAFRQNDYKGARYFAQKAGALKASDEAKMLGFYSQQGLSYKDD